MPVPANVGSGVFFEDYEIEHSTGYGVVILDKKSRLVFIQKTMKIEKKC